MLTGLKGQLHRFGRGSTSGWTSAVFHKCRPHKHHGFCTNHRSKGQKPVSAPGCKNTGPSTEPAPLLSPRSLSSCFAFSVLPNDPLLIAAETERSVQGPRHTFTFTSFAKFFRLIKSQHKTIEVKSTLFDIKGARNLRIKDKRCTDCWNCCHLFLMLVLKMGLLKAEVGQDIRLDTKMSIDCWASALWVSYRFLHLGFRPSHNHRHSLSLFHWYLQPVPELANLSSQPLTNGFILWLSHFQL